MARGLSLIVCVFAISACKSLSIGPADLNAVLGHEYSRRLVWPDPTILQYELAELTGYLIYESTDEPVPAPGAKRPADKLLPRRIKQIVKADTKLAVRPIQEGQVYESKVDSRAASQGSFLAFAQSLTAEQKAHVTIADVAICLIPARDIPWTELEALAFQHVPGTRRYWVQGTLLTLTSVRTFHKLDGSMHIGSADAFGGANGEVYVSNEQFKKSPIISMLTIDIDQLPAALERVRGQASGAIAESLTEEQKKSLLDAVRLQGIRAFGISTEKGE